MVWMGLGVSVLAVAGIWFAPRLSRYLFTGPRAEADMPCAFGCKMAWIAVRTRDTARLIETLELEDALSSSWSVGIGTVYNQRIGLERVFVTPPVDGWSFIVGLSLPMPADDVSGDLCSPLLEKLSVEFDAVQYFMSYPELSFYAWARLRSGTIKRAFACGQEGVIWNRGAVTPEERAAGMQFFDLRDVSNGDETSTMPVLRESHVLELARQWSLDPSRLDVRDHLEMSVGYIATAPLSWRSTASERRRVS